MIIRNPQKGIYEDGKRKDVQAGGRMPSCCSERLGRLHRAQVNLEAQSIHILDVREKPRSIPIRHQ